MKKYYKKHIGASLAILLGITVGDSIARKGFSIEFFIISMIVAFLLPAASWYINEKHLKRLEKKKENKNAL